MEDNILVSPEELDSATLWKTVHELVDKRDETKIQCQEMFKTLMNDVCHDVEVNIIAIVYNDMFEGASISLFNGKFSLYYKYNNGDKPELKLFPTKDLSHQVNMSPGADWSYSKQLVKIMHYLVNETHLCDRMTVRYEQFVENYKAAEDLYLKYKDEVNRRVAAAKSEEVKEEVPTALVVILSESTDREYKFYISNTENINDIAQQISNICAREYWDEKGIMEQFAKTIVPAPEEIKDELDFEKGINKNIKHIIRVYLDNYSIVVDKIDDFESVKTYEELLEKSKKVIEI